MAERMPPLEMAAMDDAQRKAAEELIAGPRKGVIGPFIALLRSPELLDRMGRVGEQLRFRNSMPQRLVELAILIASRHVDNAFEWVLHQPLAMKEGVTRQTIDAINSGRAPGFDAGRRSRGARLRARAAPHELRFRRDLLAGEIAARRARRRGPHRDHRLLRRRELPDERGGHAAAEERRGAARAYSTVTAFARLRGLSTSVPRRSAVW
jgi:hypothetical protein